MHGLLTANAANAYSRAGRQGGDARSVVMLYDGALGHLAQARAAIGERAIERRWQHVRRATAIIDGLQSCLDHGAGGEIAALLDRIYTYVGLRLREIDLRNDARLCDELIGMLTTLRRSWAQLAENVGRSSDATPAAA
jgi:flagellar secretion chaperone FliS